ncbi:MAG: class I SAM-dependent methyltransferase [Chitinispirillales bacterium]|jgi:SAM-dependent methyltransferase|nr:class I SAM-dependent methyltransferase [Chitinispirillales bacterium]
MPSFFYQIIRNSYFGRRKGYETLGTYEDIFLRYGNAAQALGVGFAGKTALEVGCGDQIFTALFLLAGGCGKVALVDPKLNSYGDAARFCGAVSAFRAVRPDFSMPDGEVRERVLCYNGLNEIPGAFNGSTDFIFTNVVLEHFHDLDVFFSAARRLLADGGVSFNTVDLSDHTYHIFRRFKATQSLSYRNALNHLRYSNKAFAFINDPKCFMNRHLLPAYGEKAAKHGLKCQIKELSSLGRSAPIHKDIAGGLGGGGENGLYATLFEMFLQK